MSGVFILYFTVPVQNSVKKTVKEEKEGRKNIILKINFSSKLYDLQKVPVIEGEINLKKHLKFNLQREENMIFKRGGILSPWIRIRRIRIRNTGGNMIFSKYRYVKYRLCTTINYPLSSTEGVSGSLVQYNKKRDTFSFL